MINDPPATDRRAALRERHHRAIIDAAAALMDETGSTKFTVDELAARADVARRTVFNHFASVDDIVTAVCAQVLSTVVETLETTAGASPSEHSDNASMVDELADALRSTDLVGPMAHLARVLGGDEEAPSPRVASMVLRAFHEVSTRLAAAMSRRHPDADPLDVELLVASFISGLVVINRHWSASTNAVDDDSSRQLWAHFLERLIGAARTGYGAASPPPLQSS